MKRLLLYVLALLAVALLSFSCSSKKGRIIPRHQMTQIYAEMFVLDQWTNSSARMHARTLDTTYVYEAVFQKYGYTVDDFLASMDYYLYDPERYRWMIEDAVAIIRKEEEELRAAYDKAEAEKEEERLRLLDKMRENEE